MKKIKLFDPVIGMEEENYIKKILHSGFWASGSGIGYVEEFEKKFQDYIDTKACVAVNSGTAALHLALSEFNLKGKEVIVPSLSFVSTAHAVTYNGGKVVFADVEPDTLCLDPQDVQQKITNKTTLIIPVHFAGMSSNLSKLTEIAHDSNIKIVEDAAHACGTSFKNKKIGSHGDMVCFSFHPVKNLAMPSGGLISINQSNFDKVKRNLFAKRWCGITDRKETSYDIKEIGWNFYMNEFSAAIGLSQLKKLDLLNTKRCKIAKRYQKEINLERKMPYDDCCSYHFYWILVKNRTEFRKKMSISGIETGTHYKPIHTFTFYKNKTYLPVTENVGKHIVSIPTHPNLSDDDVDLIIKCVNKFA